jgi:type I restriction enzyme S subunit
MTEWETVMLSDITTLIKRGRAPHYADTGTIVVSQKCVRGGNVFDPSLARRTDVSVKPVPDWAFLREGDVLVNSTGHGTLGRACLVRVLAEPATADSHVSIVRVDETKVLPMFLGTVLSHARADLEELGSGSTKQTELSPTVLGSFSIALPPLREQRRIIAVVCAVDAQIEALHAEHAALQITYTDALSLLWIDESGDQADPRRLADLMALDVDRVKVDAARKYPIAGVLNAGKGLISRGVMSGSDTDYNTLNKMRAGQVVMRKLTAWEGPISVVTDEYDGHFASAEFPTFSLKSGLSARYFNHVCRTQRLLDEMKNRVTGTVQRRKRLNPDQLLDVRLPVPPLHRQETVADALDAIYDGLALLAAELAALRRVRSDLLTAVLSQDITVDEAVDEFVEGAA